MNEQYQYMFDMSDQVGRAQLGSVGSACWRNDPKRFLFSLARYKFVSKMLEGRKNVVEAGCGDGWNSRIVKQTVKQLTLTDYDERFVDEAGRNDNVDGRRSITRVHDFIKSPLIDPERCGFDGFYCLDVLEHIDVRDEDSFIRNAIKSCSSDAILIFGMPSLESQSILPAEKRDPGHINCKSKSELKQLMETHFSVVLTFSMNDEVVHTGHESMSHYILAVCAMPKV